MGSTNDYMALLEKCTSKAEVEAVISRYESRQKKKAPAWMRDELKKYSKEN